MDKHKATQLLTGHRANYITDDELVEQLEMAGVIPEIAEGMLSMNNLIKEMNINVVKVIDDCGDDVSGDGVSVGIGTTTPAGSD